MIKFFIAISCQCKVRLMKWYIPIHNKEKISIIKELSHLVVNRNVKQCNFLEWREDKIVFKRFASLYFIACVDKDTNELMILQLIQHYVVLLDSYLSKVCELDLIFSFDKAYYLLDEILIDGNIYESNKHSLLRSISVQDTMTEKSKPFSTKP